MKKVSLNLFCLFFLFNCIATASNSFSHNLEEKNLEIKNLKREKIYLDFDISENDEKNLGYAYAIYKYKDPIYDFMTSRFKLTSEAEKADFELKVSFVFIEKSSWRRFFRFPETAGTFFMILPCIQKNEYRINVKFSRKNEIGRNFTYFIYENFYGSVFLIPFLWINILSGEEFPKSPTGNYVLKKQLVMLAKQMAFDIEKRDE